jgi:hypothetical protein
MDKEFKKYLINQLKTCKITGVNIEQEIKEINNSGTVWNEYEPTGKKIITITMEVNKNEKNYV